MRARPYRAREDDEDPEQDERDGQGETRRDEREKRDEAEGDRDDRQPVRAGEEVGIGRPERDEAERVRLRGLADEAGVGKEGDETERDDRPDDEGHARPRGAQLDPGREGRDEQGHEEEQVPVLDAVGREPRGERADDKRRGRDERDGCGKVLLHGGWQPRRAPEQHDERDDGDHGDVQRQLLDVPEPEAEHLAEVVASLADDAVRAEQVGERAAARKLGDDDEQGERDEPAQKREEAPYHPAVAPQRRKDERCDEERAHEPEGLRTGEDCGDECRCERGDTSRRRPLERPHERPREDERHRVEERLGDDRRRVGHRGDRDRGHRADEREAPTRHATRDQPGGDGCERHRDRVRRLRRRVGARQEVEDRVRRREEDRVQDAVAAGRHPTHGERPGVGDAPGELRVDQLVDEDERCGHRADEPGAQCGGGDDDPGQPHPVGHAGDARPPGVIHRGRPRRAVSRSRPPPASPERSRPRPPPRSRRRAPRPRLTRPPARVSNAAAWRSATAASACSPTASCRAAAAIASRTSGRSARSRSAASSSSASSSPTETRSATVSGSSENQPTSETTSGLPRASARMAVPEVSPIVGERRLTWTSQAAISSHRRRSST